MQQINTALAEDASAHLSTLTQAVRADNQGSLGARASRPPVLRRREAAGKMPALPGAVVERRWQYEGREAFYDSRNII
ncbi:MAG TPA: hypothetical protein VKA60_26795 [Blastocatellia bacterium]|nr:hypothetical protein [Blastocatellia bacterium]